MYMAEIQPMRRKTSNLHSLTHSLNQLINQSIRRIFFENNCYTLVPRMEQDKIE